MTGNVTMLSLAACAFYAGIAVLALRAFAKSVRVRVPVWHRLAWPFLALAFVGLIALRLYDFEGTLHDYLREAARKAGSYEARRSYQNPIAAVAIAALTLGAIGLIFGLRRLSHRSDQIVVAALACLAAMVSLVLFRIMSVHALDVLLYGPFKLNWFADLGLSSGVGIAALLYVRRLNARR